MRISLISPKWDKMVLTYPPLGLAYVAAMLERKGHEVRIHVFSLDPTSPLANDVDEVCQFSPDVVGISSMTNVYFSAMQTARLVKEKIGCPVIIGGPHASVLPERTVQEPDVDFVVFGEGEEAMVELVEAIETGDSLDNIRGLCFKKRGEVVKNQPRALLDNLDALPFPARHLLQLDRFPLRAQNGDMMVTVITSRGCPYDCSYCFKGLFGRTYRRRSCENVIAELKTIVDTYGIKNFYFIDDLFTTDVKWLTRFVDSLVAENLPMRWQCLARVDRVSPALLEQMYLAGCREIHYGVESGNQSILQGINKGISLDTVRQAISWTKQAGIMTKGYFMVGLPGDTEETIRQTIEFALDLDLDDAMFSVTTPFPGTRLWQELSRRRPQVEFDQNFARAYYFNVNSDNVGVFLNVSEISDKKLLDLARLAVKTISDQQIKRRYKSTFGALLGPVFWQLARIGVFRAIGKRLPILGSRRRSLRSRVQLERQWSCEQ